MADPDLYKGVGIGCVALVFMIAGIVILGFVLLLIGTVAVAGVQGVAESSSRIFHESIDKSNQN